MWSKAEQYYQTANREFIEKEYGQSLWVQISGQKEMNGAIANFWCALLDKTKINLVFRKTSWEVNLGDGEPGFECVGNDCEYHESLLPEGFENLIYYREFFGVKKPFVELSQEFILLNNLYFDEQRKKYFAMLIDGTADEVVRVMNEDTLLINLSYLMRYAAAKQMAIILFYDIRTRYDNDIKELEVKEFTDEYKDLNTYYEVWGGDLDMFHSHATSVLMGKKIIYPKPVETCGYWPFQKKQEYIDFIIGIDENGNNKSFTCDPSKLADYFGGNPDSPHYLTPVFFKREVLQKYFLHPDLYTVCDGRLTCKELWSVEIDNHHRDSISVYLGDLGRDLPESERLYWKSYNIVLDEGVSSTSFNRDFLNIWTESDVVEHRFKQHYIKTNETWEKKFGWPLFLSLSEDDQYNFDLLRIPLTESQDEFDSLVLSLVKVLIDSVNEKRLQESIEKEKELKGIGKLEKWLQIHGYSGFEKHIKFLRDLQELRSKGTGHRKNADYERIAASFGIKEKGFRDVFNEILTAADLFVLYMYDIAMTLSS